MDRLVNMIDGEPLLALPEEYDEDDIEERIYAALTKLCEYEDADENGWLVHLPLKIGDRAWAIRIHHNAPVAYCGVVSEMYFDDTMRLVIVVKGIGRGVYGVKVFATREEAAVMIQKIKEHGANKWKEE